MEAEREIALDEQPQDPGKSIDYSKRVSLYIGSVIVLGMVAIFLAFSQLPEDRLGLALFAALSAAAELASVELFVSSRSRVSVSAVISIAAMLVFGPLAGVCAQTAAGLMTILTTTFFQSEYRERRANWLQRAGFNVSMLAVASASAGMVFGLAGGETGRLQLPETLLPLILAVGTDVAVNLILLVGVISLQTGQSPFQIFRRDFQWGTPIMLFGGVVGGGVLALAYETFGYLGLAVFFLPVLSIGYSYRLYVTRTRVYVKRLEEVNASLDNANLGLLETLGALIDAYDIYTYGHSSQVAVYAGAIAEKMGLSREEQALIVRASLIHDIGKVGITDSILSKPGPLTEEEINYINRHPIIGADIIRRMEGMQQLVPLVRHHHEHWDGHGYPAGLAGQEIPLGARIIALADAIDAMSSDRPYRTPRGLEELRQEVIWCSGTQFDPQVVKAFLAVLEEKGGAFLKNSAAAVEKTVSSYLVDSSNRGVRYLKRSMLIDEHS